MLDTYKKIVPIAVLLLSITLSGVAQEADISWYELEEAQALAKENNKKVLIFAEASWCHNCKRMKREVFPQADIQQAMATYYYPVKIDVESDKLLMFNGEEMTQMEFSRQMRVTGTPTFFFIDAGGDVIGAQPGFLPRDVYKSLLAYVGKDLYNEIKFEAYLDQN